MFKSATVFLFLSLCMFASCSVGDEIVAKQQRYLKDVTGSTHVEDYIREDMWGQLFPNRYGLGSRPLPDNHITPSGDFYSFHAFLLAAAKFPKFCGVGSTGTRKRELAAFLANVAQETSGAAQDAPGGYYIWGLYRVSERSSDGMYIDTTSKRYQPVDGMSYSGRGPLQLRGNDNYGAFSEAYYGSKDTLLQHPDRLLEDPVASFASAIWLWMTPQYPMPSCHSIITGKWKPASDDIANGRRPGFGATVNAITGGTECGITPPDKIEYRAQYYRYFCRIFNVAPGKNIECAGQKPFGN